MHLPSRFGSVVAHPDLDWEVLASSPGKTKILKMVIIAPQPVMVIMSFGKGNVLAIKRLILYTMDFQTKVV